MPAPQPRLPARLALGLARRLPAGRREQLMQFAGDQPAVVDRVLERGDLADRVLAFDDERLARFTSELARGLADRAGQATPATLKALVDELPFELWERHGWHLTTVGPGSPVPDTATLDEALWKEPGELPGLDLREREQVAFLERLAATYGAELAALPAGFDGPGRFFLDNPAFGRGDAEPAWALLREAKPARVLQVGGSGWPALLAEAALAANAEDGGPDGRVLVAEAHPPAYLRDAAAAPGSRIELLESGARRAGLDTFTALGPGDVVMADTTHVLRIDSEARWLLLEVLPRLAPGVLACISGIFLPEEYPRAWFTSLPRRFANEQYAVQAFLSGNRDVELVWAARWMHCAHPGLLARHLPGYDPAAPGPTSLWLRRTA
jgi:hypothetical protein